MATKEKKSKKPRAHKTSQGSARGSKPVKLTEIQKILISNGGIGHPALRARRTLAADFKRRRKLDA